MILQITMGLLLMAIGIFVLRLILIKNIHDKLLSLNLLTIKVVLLLAVYAAYEESPFILDIVLASSLVGFIATAVLIVYIGRNDV
ncbi:MAG: hypothetical protein AVO33_02935 [delta proteobacterium ML8_F1]|nr:MAG: hypothetical protein AVO33_02935 [delta proteobacterium ML8_F1]